MTATPAGGFIENVMDTYLTGKTVKAMLCGSGYTFDKHAHVFRSSVTSEVSGTGYTAGGITLTGVDTQRDTVNSRVEVVADDADFGTVTLAGVTQIVVYIDTGNAATDRIIGVHTFSTQSPNGVAFTYAWDANGIGYLSY